MSLSLLFFIPLLLSTPLEKQNKKTKNILSSISTKRKSASTKNSGLWKATKKTSVLRMLTSENPKDILEGLKNVYSVDWQTVRRLVLPLIYHLDDSISNRVMDLAVKHKEKIASALLRQKVVFSFTSKEKIQAIQLLASLGNHDDHSFFNRLLRYQNLKVRIETIKTIGTLGISSSANSLIRLLGDSREQVRLEVIKALTLIGGNQVIIPLISKLSDVSTAVRLEAVRSLSKFKSKKAKLALLRMLRTGSKQERLAVLETLTYGKTVTSQLKHILRTGNIKERIKAIGLLKGYIDNETVLLLTTLCSNYKYSAPLLKIAGIKIKPTDLLLIKTLIFKPKLIHNRRYFLAKLIGGSKITGSINLLKSIKAKKLLTDFYILDILAFNDSAQSIAFQIDLFKKVIISSKIRILNSFISRGDDRLAPQFLKSMQKDHTLGKYLIKYASATRSSLFLKPLLSLLSNPSYNKKGAIIAALRSINDPISINRIIDSGSFLKKETLLEWSSIIFENLNRKVALKLKTVPIINKELENEIIFLMAAAKIKGIKIPEFNQKLSKKISEAKLWIWAAGLKKAPIIKNLKAEMVPFAIDLLHNKNRPKNSSKLLKKTPSLLSALARFKISSKYLVQALSSPDECTRINATIGLRNEFSKDTKNSLRLVNFESSNFAKFNILFYSKQTRQIVKNAQLLHGKNSGISKTQWGMLLGKWSTPLAKKLAKKWNIKIIKNRHGKRDHLIRFHFYQLPKSLNCIVVSKPSGGFRAMTPPKSNNLVLLGLKKGKVTVHPIFHKK
jgi:HEAT repeats